MPTTYVDYTATAAQTDFAFTFPYLEDEHVIVEIDGVQKTLTTDYTIVTSPSTKIVLTSGATAGQIVRVRRKSQPGTDLVDFENGSVLTESELDRAYLHNRYLNEEIGELNDASLQKEAGGTDWDAGGSKIKNVGAPTLTADATTKQYVDDKVNQLSSGASAPPTKWVFTGTAGANTTYSVTDAEVNGDTAYDVSVDGSVLEPTTDYTVDPDTDTLTIVNTLSGGEDIVVIERGFGVAITGTIGADQLQSNAVTTAKINNNAVTTAKLADHSVTAVKISNTDPIFNVQTTGEVGIGTASPDPAVKLHMHQQDSSGYATTLLTTTSQSFSVGVGAASAPIVGVRDKFYIYDNATLGGGSRLIIDSAGNVGIGTDTPSKLLSIVGSNAELRVAQTTAASGAVDLSSTATGGVINVRDASGVSVIDIDARPGNEIVFNNGGNVGIGTASPTAPLEVASSTGGVVFPRLTTTQRNAISSPTDGETIFNSTTTQLEAYNGSDWVAASSGGITKYDSGFVNTDGVATVDDDVELTFTHNLGTDALTVAIYARIGAAGAIREISFSTRDGSSTHGAQVTAISSTTLQVSTGDEGFLGFDQSNQAAAISFSGNYIRVVAIG